MATAVFGTAARVAPDRLLVCAKSGRLGTVAATEDTPATLSPITPSLYCYLLSCLPVITALGDVDVLGAPGDVGAIPDRACAICTIEASSVEVLRKPLTPRERQKL
jgi:hypothetical protein